MSDITLEELLQNLDIRGYLTFYDLYEKGLFRYSWSSLVSWINYHVDHNEVIHIPEEDAYFYLWTPNYVDDDCCTQGYLAEKFAEVGKIYEDGEVRDLSEDKEIDDDLYHEPAPWCIPLGEDEANEIIKLVNSGK